MINYDELDEIEDGNKGWRSAFPDLSTVYVPGEGDNPEAIVIGEAPGAVEEIQRRPFVGPAGVALRDLMALANLFAAPSEERQGRAVTVYRPEPNCWLTNVVKFRPPRNRTPIPLEIMAARPWLRREWYAVGRPRLIIPVGAVALHALLGRRVSILRVSGKPQRHVTSRGLPVWVYPMIHPSFGIRNPAVRPMLVDDWHKLFEWRQRGRLD